MDRRHALNRLAWIPASLVAALGIWSLVGRGPDGPRAPTGSSGPPERRAGLAPHEESLPLPAPTSPAVPVAPAQGVRLSPLDPALRGVGSVRLRVVRATDGTAVPDAAVVLHGTGHGGETVHVAARSAKDGVVTLADVPAGPWLTLQVDAAGEATVVRADVDVDRDRVRDLGDVAVGARRTLRVVVLDDASRPVPGATVVARPLTPRQAADLGWGRWQALDPPIPESGATGRTDRDGAATLGGIRPGTCLLEASEGTRVPARTVVEVPSTADPVLPALILRTAQVVAGRVVDVRGAGVAGARLVAVWRHGLGYALPRREVADGDGRFRFALPRSALPCELWVESGDMPRTRVAVEETTDDLAVTLPDGAPMDLTAADADTGAPLADARVEVRVAGSGAEAGRKPWECMGRTDENGRLRTTLLPGRLVELRVDPIGYLHGIAPPRDREDAVFESVPAPAEIEAGKPVRVEARLHPWPSAEGVGSDVVGAAVAPTPSATVRGRVTDDAGRPISGAHVALGEGPVLGGPIARETTDPEGRFVLTGIHSTDRWGDPRHLRLFVSARGHAESRESEFEVPAGRTVDGGDLSLPRAPTVAGAVLDASGSPAAGVRLTLHPKMWINPGPRPEHVFFAVSDARGRFHIASGGDLRHTVLHAAARHPGEVDATVDVPTDGDARERLVLRLAAGGACEGTVVDAEGKPVWAATVVVVPGDPTSEWFASALTDTRGRFRILCVPVGPVLVGAYDGNTLFEEYDASAESQASIPLSAPLRITLRAASADEVAEMRTSRQARWQRDDGALVPPEDTEW